MSNKCEEDVTKLEREVVEKMKAMEVHSSLVLLSSLPEVKKMCPFQAKLGIPSRETVATEASHLATKIEELEWRMLQVEVVCRTGVCMGVRKGILGICQFIQFILIFL
jgi:hypothetical protein